METLHLTSLGKSLLISALALLIYSTVCGVIAIRKKRADLADVSWGPGFIIVAWASFIISTFSNLSLLLNILISVWAIRLAIHIYLKHHKKQEDFRYIKLKKTWGKHVSLKIFFQVFLFQGLILYVVSLPIIWINTHPEALSLKSFLLAAAVWLLGFILETISDYQLFVFKRSPSNKGKLLKTGLWSFVRHPNYLGEIIMWWAVWFICISIPLGWTLVFSPVLITYLIVKVSGISPIEEKMKSYPEFGDYIKNTPSLVPFSFFNGLIFTISWLILVFFGAKKSFVIPLVSSFLCFTTQLFLISKFAKKCFLISVPLSVYALVVGIFQETLFIHFKLLSYPNGGFFPPLWLLSLYPLFSFTLNSSLIFLNKNLVVAFFVGGAGSLMSYLFGQNLGAVSMEIPQAYPWIFTSWGLYLTVIIIFNRKLISLREKYTNQERLSKPVVVFFDINCPVCYREMVKLKKQEQTGSIIYACPKSDEELKKITSAFSYKQSMKKIHALDANGNILTGIDVLAETYARTNLAILAIILQAPGFRLLFKLLYAVWAKFRLRLNSK